MSDDENFPLSERSPSSEIQSRGQQIPNFDENRENNQENQDFNRVNVQDGENNQKSSFESKTKLKVQV